jgi:hypothetical protein
MGKKKAKGPKQRLIETCQNNGGLGIEPCNGNVAVVTVTVDPAFTGLDGKSIDLCVDCAARLQHHAADFGYDVEIDG